MVAGKANSKRLALSIWGPAAVLCFHDRHATGPGIMKCDCLKWKTDKTGLTAFMQAAKAGHIDCLIALLPRSDPKAKSEKGWTALALTMLHGGEEVVGFLAPLSDPNAVTSGDMTPAMWAATFGNEKALRVLLPVSDLSLVDYRGATALELAETHGNEGCAEMIRAHLLSQAEKRELDDTVPPAPTRKRMSIDD